MFVNFINENDKKRTLFYCCADMSALGYHCANCSQTFKF